MDTGECNMAGSTRARRRLSLFAGGSLALACLTPAAGALVLAPTAALAANECGDPSANGPAADVFDCTGSQAAISYATDGNLTLRMNNGVATTTGGVVVSSSLTNTVTINRVDTPADSGDPQLVSTSGAGVQVTSAGTGSITVNLSDPDTLDTPTLTVSGTTAGVQLTGSAAISLTTTNGAITATGATGVGAQATNNSIAGGNITMTLGGSVSGATGVQTTLNGTGSQTVTLTAASATVSGGDVSGLAGPAVQMITLGSGTGAATLTVGTGRTVRANGAINAVVEIANANGARTITNNGVIRSNDAAATGYDDLAVRIGAGAGAVTLSNSAGALLSGRVLLANSGTAAITNNSVWHTAGLNTLGLGATTLTNTATGVLAVSGAATTLDFQSGSDIFANAGVLAVGEGPGAATLTTAGLETWNNSGRVLFGADAGFTTSDGEANDRVVTAATFTGVIPDFFSAPSDSTLVMDVDFTGAQDDCGAAVAADCLDLRGGATNGLTSILVNGVGAGRALAGRIVLVDVNGGFSGDGRFILDPDSADYALDEDGEAIIDAGILHYDFLYDAVAKQHFLAGAPDTEALELGLFATFARDAWGLATGTWFDRGLDTRQDLEAEGPGSGAGAWLRVSAANSDRDMTQSFTLGGVTTEYDTSYSQDMVVLAGGVDLVRAAGQDTAWVFGVTAGHAASDTGFSGSPSTLELTGYFAGVYSSLVSGPVFVDAIVNAAKFDLAHEASRLGASIDDGQATSVGFQAEGGYRLNVRDMPAFIEPLVAVSYVRTEMDALELPGVTAAFDSVGNFRGGLGLRIAGDKVLHDWTTRFSFTARGWEEFDGQSQVALTNAALDLPLVYDDASDRLGDVDFAVNSRGMGGRLSLQLGLRMQFKRDYENRQVSLGARYVW